MQGLSCDMCRKFSPFAFNSTGMFGQPIQSMPANWITMVEEKPQPVMSGLLDVISSAPEPPRQPCVFCSRECARNYLVAATLVDGPGAQ